MTKTKRAIVSTFELAFSRDIYNWRRTWSGREYRGQLLEVQPPAPGLGPAWRVYRVVDCDTNRPVRGKRRNEIAALVEADFKIWQSGGAS